MPGKQPEPATIQPPYPLWLTKAEETLHRLVDLPENWNSYGSRRIDPEIARQASRLLVQLAQPDTPEPSVVPTRRGGVQIEWHDRGIDLEINLVSPKEMHVSFEDGPDDEEWEQELSYPDIDPLTQAITKLSNRKS